MKNCIASYLFSLLSLMEVSAYASEPIRVDLTELEFNPNKYDGRLVYIVGNLEILEGPTVCTHDLTACVFLKLNMGTHEISQAFEYLDGRQVSAVGVFRVVESPPGPYNDKFGNLVIPIGGGIHELHFVSKVEEAENAH